MMSNETNTTPRPPAHQKHHQSRPVLLLCALSAVVVAAGFWLVVAEAAQANFCQNIWKFPEDCQAPNCTYQIVWRYKQAEDAIEFIISSKHPDRWTGIIFANEANISASDGIFAWVEDNSYVMMDAHLPEFGKTISDKYQSVTNISAHLLHGVATFRFVRKRDTQDPEDISFADNAPCPYLIFPVDGGSVDYKTRTIVSNEHHPYISDKRVCIKACETSVNAPSSSTTSRPHSPFPSPSRTSTSRPRSTTSTTTTTTTPKPTTQAPVATTSKRPASTSTSTTTTTTTTTTNTQAPTTTTTTRRPTTTTSTTTTQAPTTTSKRPSTTTTTQTPVTTTISPKLLVSSSNEQSTVVHSADQQQWCAGRWSHPPNCRFKSPAPADVIAYLQTPIDSSFNIRPLPIELSDCSYFAQWQFLEQSDSIEFIIQTKTRNRWTGIGFSNTTKMANSDAIIGLIEEHSGRHFIMDTWLRDHVMPEIDTHQNIKQTFGDQLDFQFTDQSCAYFFFPTQGGSFNAISKRMHKHEAVPSVSEHKICVRSCGAASSRPADQSSPPPTTTSTSQSSSNVESASSGPDPSSSLSSSAATSTPSPGSGLSTPNSFLNQQSTPAPSSTPIPTSSSTQTAPATNNQNNQPAEKGLDTVNPVNAPPSNDLSADLDGTVSSSTALNGQASTPPPSPTNPFSRLAFLSEPSLRWLAGIGCVATLLAMIVFQACFTMYKNKQAYKQNLYRQSAFKQNTYLHNAYLTQHDTASSVVGAQNYSSSGAGSTNTQSSNTATAITSAAAATNGHHHHGQHHGHHPRDLTGSGGHVVSRSQVVAGAAGAHHLNPLSNHHHGRHRHLHKGELDELKLHPHDDDEVDDMVDEDELIDEEDEDEEEELEEFDHDLAEDYDDDMNIDDAFDFEPGHHHNGGAGAGHYIHPAAGHRPHHHHSGGRHHRHHPPTYQQHPGFQQAALNPAAANSHYARGSMMAHHHHHPSQGAPTSLSRRNLARPAPGGHYRSAGHLMDHHHGGGGGHHHHHHRAHPQQQPHSHRSQPTNQAHLLANGGGGHHHHSHQTNSVHPQQRPDSYFLPSQRRF